MITSNLRGWDSDGLADLIHNKGWYDAGTMDDYRKLKQYVDDHPPKTECVMHVAANITRRTHDFSLDVHAVGDEITAYFRERARLTSLIPVAAEAPYTVLDHGHDPYADFIANA